jgi:hypothetical protein
MSSKQSLDGAVQQSSWSLVWDFGDVLADWNPFAGRVMLRNKELLPYLLTDADQTQRAFKTLLHLYQHPEGVSKSLLQEAFPSLPIEKYDAAVRALQTDLPLTCCPNALTVSHQSTSLRVDQPSPA